MAIQEFGRRIYAHGRFVYDWDVIFVERNAFERDGDPKGLNFSH
jgi:hypothetical protein